VPVNPTDSLVLKDRLAEIADAVGAKAPGELGVKAWYIALKDFPIDKVVGALDTWLRTKPKMPAPADIRQIVAASVSDRLEATLKANAEPFRLTPQGRDPNSPAYLKFKAWWAAFKANSPPCPYPDHRGGFIRVGAVIAASDAEPDVDFWWRSIIERATLGDRSLKPAQIEFARRAAANAGVDMTALSEAEREFAAERAAIIGEGARP